jgi:hypothetical protein
MARAIDIGRTFGRWTVTRDGDRRRDRKIMRVCRCVCSIERPVRADALVAGATVSCGCYRRDLLAARNRAQRGRKRKPLSAGVKYSSVNQVTV